MEINEAWDAFWSNKKACILFGSDDSNEQEVYYCLGELAIILCRDNLMHKRLQHAYNEMNSIQKAAFLDACNVTDMSEDATDLWRELQSKENNPILTAAILRVLIAIRRSQIEDLINEVKNHDDIFVKGRFADELSKMKKLIDSEFFNLKDNCILE